MDTINASIYDKWVDPDSMDNPYIRIVAEIGDAKSELVYNVRFAFPFRRSRTELVLRMITSTDPLVMHMERT